MFLTDKNTCTSPAAAAQCGRYFVSPEGFQGSSSLFWCQKTLYNQTTVKTINTVITETVKYLLDFFSTHLNVTTSCVIFYVFLSLSWCTIIASLCVCGRLSLLICVSERLTAPCDWTWRRKLKERKKYKVIFYWAESENDIMMLMKATKTVYINVFWIRSTVFMV